MPLCTWTNLERMVHLIEKMPGNHEPHCWILNLNYYRTASAADNSTTSTTTSYWMPAEKFKTSTAIRLWDAYTAVCMWQVVHHKCNCKTAVWRLFNLECSPCQKLCLNSWAWWDKFDVHQQGPINFYYQCARSYDDTLTWHIYTYKMIIPHNVRQCVKLHCRYECSCTIKHCSLKM